MNPGYHASYAPNAEQIGVLAFMVILTIVVIILLRKDR